MNTVADKIISKTRVSKLDKDQTSFEIYNELYETKALTLLLIY